MINFLWFFMLAAGLVVAGLTGRIDAVTERIFTSAEKGVSISIGLISIMTFWLGIMRIIEKSGLINYIKFILKPVALFLFPKIPKDHPAMNAILMNMSANLLGMGNAATPFGLKAMQDLQELNGHSPCASDEMCTFLALNTSSLTLIPTTVIGLRVATGSLNPTEIVGTTIVATLVSTTAAILFDRLLRKFYRRDEKK
jgi:spore maturation protein A